MTKEQTDLEGDADPDADTDTDSHSGRVVDSSRPHTGSVPQLHSAGTIDSAFVPLRSDSGGPACVASVARNRAVLTGWGDPLLSPDCDITAVGPVNPGPLVRAEEMSRGRVDGVDFRGYCGAQVLMLGDTDHDGVGEYSIGCATLGELLVFEGMPQGVLTKWDAQTYVEVGVDQVSEVEEGSLLGPYTHALVVGGTNTNSTKFILPLPLPSGQWSVSELAVATVVAETYDNRGGVLAVGDWDADGIDDLTVSGVVNDPNVGAAGVNLFLGPFDGDRDPLQPDLMVGVAEEDATWAAGIGSSGIWSRGLMHDMNGDGYPELGLGGELNPNLVPPTSGYIWPHGGVWLFDGGPGILGELTAADARAHLYGSCTAQWDAFMFRSVGDVTGDCLADVAAGSAVFDLGDGTFRGGVFVLSELRRSRGTLPISAAATAVILGENVGDQLHTVGFVGDWNLDGFDELVVGATDPFDEGKVYVFLGPVSGTMSAADADLVITGAGQFGSLGGALRGGRDLDADGVPDLLVGARGSSLGGVEFSGSVFVFSGADLLGAM